MSLSMDLVGENCPFSSSKPGTQLSPNPLQYIVVRKFLFLHLNDPYMIIEEVNTTSKYRYNL